MKVSKQEYSKMAERASKNSPIVLDCVKAFLFGGGFCVIGQVLMNLYKGAGLDKETASAVVSVSMVFLGAALTAVGWYEKIAKHAGAGSLVPITGFANSVVAPAIEFKAEGYVLGLGAKMFIIAGPVIVYGTLASVIYGLIYFFFTRVIHL